jgi:hypothetical protein
MDKRAKRLFKRLYKNSERARADELATRECMLNRSLRDSERYHAEDEYTYYYGFVDFDGDDPNDVTDDEIQEFFDSQRMVIVSPYDCTGYEFTRWIDWHRNPDGSVSYVHATGRDI